MRHLILSFLLFFVAPVWASSPPVLRLDQPVSAFSLPSYVQVRYTDALQYVVLRLRYQTSAAAAPVNGCIVMRPSATPPPGVPTNQWVPVDTGVVFDSTIDKYMPFWNSVCQSD